MLTFTVDDIKRLIPEANVFKPDYGLTQIELFGIDYDTEDEIIDTLLTTRAEVERLTTAMKEIDKGFYSHKLTIREAQQLIRQALEKGVGVVEESSDRRTLERYRVALEELSKYTSFNGDGPARIALEALKEN